MNNERCFACGRKIKTTIHLADTRDDQIVYVGKDCWKKIKNAGENGWQPDRGGPKLYLIKEN